MTSRVAAVSVLASLFCCLSIEAKEWEVDAEKWNAWLELEGRVATDRSIARGNLFAPVWQNGESLLFFDFRGLTTNEDATEGNVGFGYRKLIGPDRILGFYGFYDFRETEFDNEFHQGSLGAELLGSRWGFRINGYLPEDNLEVVSSLNTAFISGGNVFVRQGLEGAYRGFDIEAERMLWSSAAKVGGKNPIGGGKGPLRVARFDAEWWASAGLFHFEQGDANFEDITGPRIRTEFRLWNLPYFGNDSRLVISGQYEYDEVRGSVGTGGLAVRIPLGRSQSAPPSSGIHRRMMAAVVRDVDIVTNAGAFGAPEKAKFARTGQLINGTVTVDGNTADPEATIEGAGENSLVLANGDAGVISLADVVDMNMGQVVLGGGSVIGVVGCETGAHSNLMAPGSRPTFDATVNASFNGATNGMLKGLNLTSEGSVRLNDVTNFVMDDLMISVTADGIFASNSQFKLFNSSVQTFGSAEDGIDANDSQYMVVDSVFDVGDDGIEDDRGTFSIMRTSITAREDGFDLDESTAEISDSTVVVNAENNGDSLIDDRGNSRISIDGSEFVLNGIGNNNGFSLLGITQSFVMKNSNVIINNSRTGFNVSDIGIFTLENSTVTLSGNTNSAVGLQFSQRVNSTISLINTRIDNNVDLFGSDGLNLSANGTATVFLNLENSHLTTARGPVMDEIFSNDMSNLTVNILNSTLTGEGQSADAVEDFTSNENSTLNVNLIGSSFISSTTDSIEEFASNDTSTMNIVIRDSTLTGAADSSLGDGIDELRANNNSVMKVTIEGSTLTGNGSSGDGIDDIFADQSAQLTAVFSNSTFRAADPRGSTGEGIEDIESRGIGSQVDVTITNSTIAGAGAGGNGIDEIGSGFVGGATSTLRVTFINNTITAGGPMGEGISTLNAKEMSTTIASFQNNTIVGGEDAVDATSSDTGVLNVEFKNNTLTSGAGFFDFNFNQTGGSTFNVVDLPTLSTPDNNGASFNSMGAINSIIALP